MRRDLTSRVEQYRAAHVRVIQRLPASSGQILGRACWVFSLGIFTALFIISLKSVGSRWVWLLISASELVEMPRRRVSSSGVMPTIIPVFVCGVGKVGRQVLQFFILANHNHQYCCSESNPCSDPLWTSIASEISPSALLPQSQEDTGYVAIRVSGHGYLNSRIRLPGWR